jgi:hypothetical protein
MFSVQGGVDVVAVLSSVAVLSLVLSSVLVSVELVLEDESSADSVVSVESFDGVLVVVGSIAVVDEEGSSWPGRARQAVKRRVQAAPVDDNLVGMMRSVAVRSVV